MSQGRDLYAGSSKIATAFVNSFLSHVGDLSYILFHPEVKDCSLLCELVFMEMILIRLSI